MRNRNEGRTTRRGVKGVWNDVGKEGDQGKRMKKGLNKKGPEKNNKGEG